jgi:outer membrane protein OmpA-like peptidoglycan-associated protein
MVVTDTQIEILDPVRFLTGSASLDPRSLRILDAIASTLSGNPSIKLVAVHAYAIDTLVQFQGRIAAERAQVVVDQLVVRGVARNRLVAQGAATPPPGGSAMTTFEILARDP